MKDYGTIVDGRAVVFHRLLDGPIERVWDYLTKREHLATWLGDGEIGVTGSKFALKQQGPKVPHPTGATIEGTVVSCNPPRRLSYTWIHLPPGATKSTIAESIVTMELEPVGDKVRLTVTHSEIDPAFVARLGTGWHAFLDILARRMAGREPEPTQQMFARLLPEYERKVSC